MEKEMETWKESHKDTIPWNVRVQIQKTLETWKKNDEMFVDTRAAKHVLKCIKTSNCVIVTASSGVGKTATVRHVHLQMVKDGYDIIPITDPCDISKFYHPTQKTLFVVDDLCGKYSLNQTDTDKWKSQIQCFEALLTENMTKLIMSCRLEVYQDEQFKRISLFRSCECNLLSENLCLVETEKKSIADKYLGKNATQVKEYYDLYDFFSLLCKLYKENSKVNISKFFSEPYSVYEGELDKLSKEGTVKYCALGLCVMFNNRLDEKSLTEDVGLDIRTVIKNTCEACKLSRSTARPALRVELDSMLHTSIKKEGNIYCAIHDKVFDFMAYYFGKVIIKTLIINADASFISKRFLFQRKEESDQFVIMVPTECQPMYTRRMVKDLFKNNVTYVFYNRNMYVKRFRQEFLCHLQTLTEPEQKVLSHKIDQRGLKQAVIMVVCFHGDIDMLKWCFKYNVNVNQCRLDGVTPLHIACQKGHTEIVNILLNNKADINKCTNKEISPLFKEGHTEIVNILLNNKADINKCRDMGNSPLSIACVEGHAEIVKILISNKADISNCDKMGLTPLLIACAQRHTGIVNILLENEADINECCFMSASPLHIVVLVAIKIL